jgi:hypothetical protein
MPDLPPDAPALPARRDLLRALLLAPAAAACASTAPAAVPAGSAAGAPGPAEEDPGAAALRAIREHPLPPGAEPALVFRAGAGRGR